MRLIRFIAPNGRIHFGEERPDGSALILDGSIIEGFARTSKQSMISKLIAPLEPTDIICIGRNYHAPDARAGPETDATLEVFLKPSTALQNPNDPIVIPHFAGIDPQLDCEGELAIVIGPRNARNVSESDALKYVFGYTIANDVTARCFQTPAGPPTWMRGKGFDTFGPLGPTIVTADEIPNPNSLTIRTMINGQIVRQGNTRDMIRSVPEIIAALSRHMTLRAGAVILTGAPPAHVKSSMQAGDRVAVEVGGIGSLLSVTVSEREAGPSLTT